MRNDYSENATLAAARAGEIRVLKKFGAFTRRRIRSMLRKRKAVSTPGAPPSSHTGRLKAGVLFAVDEARRSVVVGIADPSGSGTPARVEHGGFLSRLKGGKTTVFSYRARPVVGPAFEAELGGGRVSADIRALLAR